MSEFSSTGDNVNEASGSFSFKVQDSNPTLDESLPKEKGNDSFDEISNVEEPTKLDIGSDNVGTQKPEEGRSQAALRLQKVYRSFRTRRQLADCAVVVEQKWWKILDLAELKRSSISFFDVERHGSALSKWSRARTKAAKVGKGLSKDEKARKLALQHWLEAIDPRHRYGHNLQFYYVKWLHCDSTQPFFYWLDIGEGREVDLERCSRSKLHHQCIKYLGPNEREEYEVMVVKGRFFYKKSRSVIDTSGEPKGTKWIFVLSACKKLYVGQKVRGTFQHSSFLAGGATLSAGRLVVEDGYLKAVWPHSGHYLPTEENFQAFMSFLVQHHVDLTHVQKAPLEDEEESSHKKEKAHIALDQLKREPSKKWEIKVDEKHTNNEADPRVQKEVGEQEQKKDENSATTSTSKDNKIKVAKLRIPSRKHMFSTHVGMDELKESTPCDLVYKTDEDSSSSGYETAEESFLNEVDFIYTKMHMFDDDEEDEFKDAISQEIILKRINTHRRTKSYQLAEQLNSKWTTGAGPRIGCLRDYPSRLQFHAMENVNLSPRGVRCLNSPGSASRLKRDLFKVTSPLGLPPELPSPLGLFPEFHSPQSSDFPKEVDFPE